MKHNWTVTLLLLLLYCISHATGLYMIQAEMNVMEQDGKRTVTYGETALGERPKFEGFSTLLYLAFGVGIGTLLLLVLMRYKQYNLWKFWFFTASFLAISLALGTITTNTIAFTLGFGLALAKILTANTIIHNASEVLMYAGIAVFFAPMLDVWWGIALLFAFSIYDAYAVWQSQHMVDMAEFQSKTVFAGLNLSYDTESIHADNKTPIRAQPSENTQDNDGPRAAILGGGDIAIPLLFSASVMEYAVIRGVSFVTAYIQGMLVTLTSAITLLLLFYYSEKGSLYPAMPFITVGCLIGFGIVLLL